MQHGTESRLTSPVRLPLCRYVRFLIPPQQGSWRPAGLVVLDLSAVMQYFLTRLFSYLILLCTNIIMGIRIVAKARRPV